MKKLYVLVVIILMFSVVISLPVFAQTNAVGVGLGQAEAIGIGSVSNPQSNSSISINSEASKFHRSPGSVYQPSPFQQFTGADMSVNVVDTVMFLTWWRYNATMKSDFAAIAYKGNHIQNWTANINDKTLKPQEKVLIIPGDVSLATILQSAGIDRYKKMITLVTPSVERATDTETNIFQLTGNAVTDIAAKGANIVQLFARPTGKFIEGKTNGKGITAGGSLIRGLTGISFDGGIGKTDGTVTTFAIEGLQTIGFYTSLTEKEWNDIDMAVKIWLDIQIENIRQKRLPAIEKQISEKSTEATQVGKEKGAGVIPNGKK